MVSIELGLGIYLIVRDGEGAGIVSEENARVGIVRRGETPWRIIDDEAVRKIAGRDGELSE
jgi:hypothetical protein